MEAAIRTFVSKNVNLFPFTFDFIHPFFAIGFQPIDGVGRNSLPRIIDEDSVFPVKSARLCLSLHHDGIAFLNEGEPGARYEVEGVAHLLWDNETTGFVDLGNGIHKWHFTSLNAIALLNFPIKRGSRRGAWLCGRF